VLEFDGRRYTLPAAAAGQGRRWRSGDVLLWLRDDEASVTIGDQVVAWGCRRRCIRRSPAATTPPRRLYNRRRCTSMSTARGRRRPP